MSEPEVVTSTQLNALRDAVGEWAQAKGWNDKRRTVGEDIALMHSELSEALEEHRKGHHPSHSYFIALENSDKAGKPEGIPIEMIDVIIRILHFAAKYGIDLDAAYNEKFAYNERRAYRHGNKVI